MAMNETATRTISGTLYAALFLVSILINEYTFIVLVAIFGCFTLHELQRLLHLKSYAAYLILAAFILFFSVFHYLYEVNFVLILLILSLVVKVLMIRDLVLIRKIPLYERRKYLIAVFYLLTSLVFLTLIPYQNPSGQYQPEILIGVFVLIWANDSFAYIIGKAFGRHKLFERISPNKTVEGFIGGSILTILVSLAVFYYIAIFSYKIWIGLALITSIFGTFGDLIQSKLKRQAGVKDSGTLMPGHGGMFDRLDSILFAATFIYTFLVFVNHVS